MIDGNSGTLSADGDEVQSEYVTSKEAADLLFLGTRRVTQLAN